MKNLKTAKILDLIEQFQGVQKSNKFGSIEWLSASKELHVLFKEMRRRTEVAK